MLPGGALAQAPAPPLHLNIHDAAFAFGLRPSVMNASISPDGTKLATIEANGSRGSVIRVLDLTNAASQPRTIVGFEGDPDRVDWCRWTGAKRLLCDVYGMTMVRGDFAYFNRLMAVDADGANIKIVPMPGRANRSMALNTFGGSVLDWNTGKDGHVLMVRAYSPEFSTGTKIASLADGLAVDDVDTNNLHTITVENPRAHGRDFISDGYGRLRVLGLEVNETEEGYASGTINYLARPKDGAEFAPIGRYETVPRTGFNPYYVDPKLDVIYGLKKVDGRIAAYKMALDGSKKETLVLARPDVDVSGFATIGRTRRVIGVTYSTDRQEVEYFDPEMKALAASLAKAMPDLPIIRIVDASQDEKKLLIWAGSDVNPGRYFLLDRTSKAMEELTAERLPLDRVALAPVRAISITASDGSIIPAYLTLPVGSTGKNLPTIVMPHGGPSARDEWGFDWLAQYWAHIGYAVLQPNYRGSEGYGDSWLQTNGFRSWQLAIGDVNDSGAWLVKQGIADPNKLAIFGWSYGGYAALQSAVTKPGLFKAVVAVAPVTDLALLREQSKNWSNYNQAKDFIGEGKQLDEASPARQAGSIAVPVLLFHGSFDRNVSIAQSQIMVNRLTDAKKSARLVTYDKLDHYLDDSLARQDMLEQSAKFLDASFAAAK